MTRALALLLGITLVAACGPTSGTAAQQPDLELSDIQGYWVLETFTTGGASHVVDPGVNTSSTPWMEITDVIEGDAGCNGFRGDDPLHVDGNVLTPGEVVFEAMLCVESEESEPDLMQSDNAFSGLLWSEDPILVELDGDTMTWSSNDITLVFTRSDGPPPTTTLPPPVYESIGRLDCSPGIVVETRVPDTGQEPLEIAQEAAPDTVDVFPGKPLWWWGVNENDAVIVGLALGDMAGADYQVWTCDPPLDASTLPDISNTRLPDACFEFDEPHPGAFELPPNSKIVAELPFREGVLVVYRQETSGSIQYWPIECFPQGETGGGGGGPGETWQGCYLVQWSDLGYAMAILESSDWVVTIAGEPVDIVETSDGKGVALLKGSFDRTPEVVIVDDAGEPCS
jgi:heat shock protein HslJ